MGKYGADDEKDKVPSVVGTRIYEEHATFYILSKCIITFIVAWAHGLKVRKSKRKRGIRRRTRN